MKHSYVLRALWQWLHFPYKKSYRGVTLTGKTLVLDWLQLDGCTLNNCIIAYTGLGPINLTSNIVNECQFAFVGPAGNAGIFLQQIEQMVPGTIKSSFEMKK